MALKRVNFPSAHIDQKWHCHKFCTSFKAHEEKKVQVARWPLTCALPREIQFPSRPHRNHLTWRHINISFFAKPAKEKSICLIVLIVSAATCKWIIADRFFALGFFDVLKTFADERRQLSSISFVAFAMSTVRSIWIKLNGDIRHLSKSMLHLADVRFLEPFLSVIKQTKQVGECLTVIGMKSALNYNFCRLTDKKNVKPTDKHILNSKVLQTDRQTK